MMTTEESSVLTISLYILSIVMEFNVHFILTKAKHCFCFQAQESQSERNCEESEVRLLWFIKISIQTV